MSDVLIHVNETIEGSGRFQLEASLREVAGVIAPRFSPGHEAYDPDATSAATILGQVRDLGYGANIVAM